MKFKISILLLFTVCLASCQDKTELIDLQAKVLLKRIDSKSPDKLLNYANTILKDYINLNGGWSSVKYEGEIDWKMDPYNNSSWKTYFYSLRMLAVLSEAYQTKSNEDYLIKGKQILHSWNSNYKNKELNKKKHKYIWGDHPVANRVINLVHFYYVLKSANKLDLKTYNIIVDHLVEYGEWLADFKNYTGGNHAIMMDRALLYLSYVLKDNNSTNTWRELALKRFNKIIREEVTEEGVCIENSPQYHPFMMDLLNDFIVLMRNFGDRPLEEHTQLYIKMKSYLVYVLKPDLIYPFQGDTYPISEQLLFSKKYPDERLTFIESNGDKGKKPEKLDVIYKEAGYAILRDEWKQGKNFDKSTYVNFITGVPSRIHKHSDNLSFSLYSNKEDLLIDSGSWGYTKNDTVSYLSSTLAHNTFTANGTNHKNFPINSCKIIESELEDHYSIIKSIFKPNTFEEYYRTLVFIKPNIIILDDHSLSEKPINSISQIFNLGSSLESLDYSRSKRRIKANFNENKLEIHQLLKKKYDIIEYNGVKSVRGIYAKRAEATKKGNQIVFLSHYDKPVKYHNNTTLLKIVNDNQGNISNIKIEHNASGFLVKWKDKKNTSQEIQINRNINSNFFKENLENSYSHALNSKKKLDNFNIEELYVHKTFENEYTLNFKLSKNTSLEKLKTLTIGIRGYAYKEDINSLSTYSRQTKRDFDGWNLKPNDIVDTEFGKFISINITSKLDKFKKLKIYVFNRDNYDGELWNYEEGDFYFNKKGKILELNSEGKEIVTHKKVLLDNLELRGLNISRLSKDKLVFSLKLNDDVILDKYKIGFHTYVEDEDLDKLLDYSKSKKRSYDAWDFNPELTILNGEKYIIKSISTPVNKFKKIKIFLYDRKGYNGVLGKSIELENIKL